jgi:hypothetical protein
MGENMHAFRVTAVFAAAAFAVFAAAPASALINRTYVSSSGSGAACSRAAPCATFQAAHDNTTAGGEINCLDSSDFGTLTINKSISIVCDDEPGLVLVSTNVNAITVNAGANDVVVLSGLDLNGLKGANANAGISIGGATGKVQIRNSVIQGFGGYGILAFGTGNTQIFVADSYIHDNATNIHLEASLSGSAAVNAHINNVRIANGNNGVSVFSNPTAIGVNANLRDCVITGTGIAGVVTAGTGYSVATVLNSQLTGNLGSALLAQNTAGTSIIRSGNSTIMVNATGVSTSGVGQVVSYGDNNLNGNSVDGAFSGAVLAKK